MNKVECAEMLSTFVPDGSRLLTQHLQDYHEILLHIFASEALTNLLYEQLSSILKSQVIIEKYCGFIEYMWKNGDDEVRNVVDVTILERLSDDSIVWQRFATYISDAFKRYINEEVLHQNLMMNVEALR